jgi:hypothetical protein
VEVGEKSGGVGKLLEQKSLAGIFIFVGKYFL